MSGQSAKSGEAIVRGLTIAIDEINAKGGLLGKKVELLVRDDESNPAKGVIAARELVQREKVAALFGGLDTPVSIAIVPFANQAKVPFMGVWAAGTPITRNGAAENYVFRVSAVDELVDKALVDYAIKKYAAKKPGMILINNPWGESNEKGLKAALEASQAALCRHREIRDQRRRCRAAAHPPQAGRRRRAVPGRQRRAVRAGGEVARPHGLGRADRLALGAGRRPLLRARGPERRQGALHPDLQLLRQAVAQGRRRCWPRCKKKYPEIKSLADVTPAVGIANAYDAMHLTALAIAKAGSTEGPKIREAFYAIDKYDGLIKTYAKPFTPGRTTTRCRSDDYIFTYFKEGEILPLTN